MLPGEPLLGAGLLLNFLHLAAPQEMRTPKPGPVVGVLFDIGISLRMVLRRNLALLIKPICLQETEWVYIIYIYIDVYCLQFCPSQMRALMVLVVQSSMVHTESQHHSSSGHHLYCGLQYPISNLVEMSSYFDHHGERMISGRVVDSHSKHVLGVIRGLCHLLQNGCKYFY